MARTFLVLAAALIGGVWLMQRGFRSEKEKQSEGRTMAQQVCGSCHIFPEPELADRFTWSNNILPRMSYWLGYDTVDWTNEPGGAEVLASGKLPPAPVVSAENLKLIHNYYFSSAPENAKPQEPKPALKAGLKHFRVRKSNYRKGHAMTTLVKIDERTKMILVGDEGTKRLVRLKADGTLAGSTNMPNPIVHLLPREDGFCATAIGSVVPSDLAQGEVRVAEQVVLSGLRRPVECAAADLNGDGREDLVVAAFGNILGRFSWYEAKPDGSFAEHMLLDRPGAVGVKVQDVNRDARPDIIMVMAQAQEGIFLFMNRGGGSFEEHSIVHKHPAWGFSHLELVDFNRDGESDLLVTNGDNGDNVNFANGPRPYHGVRLYLNQGGGRFAESWFYPLWGAYRAVARDFDLDGDLDIAAIAFFPDYRQGSRESFVYLECEGGLRFAPSTFVESISGRWITMDAGDLDGDGDADIVLGASNRSFGDVPQALSASWQENGPSVLLLENTVRNNSIDR